MSKAAQRTVGARAGTKRRVSSAVIATAFLWLACAESPELRNLEEGRDTRPAIDESPPAEQE